MFNEINLENSNPFTINCPYCNEINNFYGLKFDGFPRNKMVICSKCGKDIIMYFEYVIKVVSCTINKPE